MDLKPDNVIVQPDGLLYLVDIDSIEVVDEQGQTLFDAPVATPEYTPPEQYRELHYDPTSRQSWDAFSLGVILYRLFSGIHPFTASGKPPYDNLHTLAEKIEAGLFVYASAKKGSFSVIPPPHESFELLPKNLKELFIQCFEAGHTDPKSRPTAEDWSKAFRAAIKNKVRHNITKIGDLVNQEAHHKSLLLPELKKKMPLYRSLLEKEKRLFEPSPVIKRGFPKPLVIDPQKIKPQTFPKSGIPLIFILLGIAILFSLYIKGYVSNFQTARTHEVLKFSLKIVY